MATRGREPIAIVAAVAVVALAGWSDFGPGSQGPVVFREPPSVSSHAGVLGVTLVAQRATIDIGGQQAVTEVYDGRYAPPTLRVRPGDVIRLRLVNQLDQPTNLHTHGLHVSPSGNSDNVFLTVPPGQSEDFEFRLPANHPSGLFWYHPHTHHFSNEQVRNGISGASSSRGCSTPFPLCAASESGCCC